ncbi:MAG: hypothetical protein GAK34_02609 [Delftia tsuruhatensis]|nr:MAG: hypothetical protein GAK34_02609 [Delftia tsuruhatensis]
MRWLLNPQRCKHRRRQAQRRQHAIDGGKACMRGQAGQQGGANGAAQGHGGLADAHGQAALAFGKPAHDGPATGTVDAAAQQAHQHQPAGQQAERRDMVRRWRGPERHRRQGQGRAAQAQQQHRPVAPAVRQQAPGQFAERNAQAHQPQRQAQRLRVQLVARTHEDGRHGDAAESHGKRGVGDDASGQHLPSVAGRVGGSQGAGIGAAAGGRRGHGWQYG